MSKPSMELEIPKQLYETLSFTFKCHSIGFLRENATEIIGCLGSNP